MARASRRSSASFDLTCTLLVGGLLAASTAPAVPPGAAAPVLKPGVWAPPPCPAAIDDLVDGSAVDLAARGFELRKLGPGYSLESFDVRAEGACDPTGAALAATLKAHTTWRRQAGGEPLEVTQQVADVPVANVLESSWATFGSDGYAFGVSSWPYAYEPFPRRIEGDAAVGLADLPGAPAALKARALRVGRGSAATQRPRLAAKDAPPNLLVEAIAALAPEVDLDCFHRRVEGEWEDLAGLGIGDPRPVVPSGYSQAYFQLSYYEPPAAGCDGPVPPSGRGVSFSAAGSSSDGGWIGVSIYSRGDGYPAYTGYLDDHSAYWSNEELQYGIWVSNPGGSGNRALVIAIATALDPGFSTACLLEVRYLTPDEAIARGFHLAQPPAGYTQVASHLWSQSASAGCDDPPPAAYGFYWSFSDGDDGIDAGLHRNGEPPAPTSALAEKSGGLSWTDAAGTSYWVYGYSYSGESGPSDELLLEVARSMDPTYPGP